MKKTILFLSLSTLIMVSCKNENKNLALITTEDTLSYALGFNIGSDLTKNMEAQGLDTVVDFNKFLSGMKTAFDTGEVELVMSEEEVGEFLNAYFMAQQTKQLEEQKKKFQPNIDKGVAFLAENGKRAGVVTTASGLQYEILKKGNGPKPAPGSTVKTHYHGTFLDGRVFDSSVERGEPVKFPIDRVIPGWTEALQLMPVGSKWKVWVPHNLAYDDGSGPGGKIEPYSTLTFEIELLGIEK